MFDQVEIVHPVARRNLPNGERIVEARLKEENEAKRLLSELERMRKAVKFAESIAPTHPHAGIESATANLLVGPFASMIDRARDAISGNGKS